MKQLKLLGLVGLAVIPILLFAGAGTSSATVLCKTTATPCESSYEKEATINASLSGTAVLTNTEGVIMDSCSSGSAEVVVTSAGGEALQAAGKVTSLTWGGCSTTTHTIEKGNLSIQHIAGTDNGTVVGTGFNIAVTYKGLSCHYGLGGGVDLGVLRGRENPILEIAAVVSKVEGSVECPADAFWYANYKLSEPLYIEPNGVAWCKTTTTPCEASYEAGATFKAGMSGSAVLKTLGGTLVSTCTGGALSGEVATDGGKFGAVPIPIEALTWSGCTSVTATVRVGELDFSPNGGTDNAGVAYSGTEVTYNLSGVTCGYGGNGAFIGTFKGGEKPKLEVKAVLSKSSGSFLCPKEAYWEAEYKVEEPTPLYVETS
jgi:hypothetical protein